MNNSCEAGVTLHNLYWSQASNVCFGKINKFDSSALSLKEKGGRNAYLPALCIINKISRETAVHWIVFLSCDWLTAFVRIAKPAVRKDVTIYMYKLSSLGLYIHLQCSILTE